MNINKASIIKDIVNEGRANDLLDLLAGRSIYNISRTENEDIGLELTKIISGARRHLQFIDKFGFDKEYAEEDGVKYFPSPDKFEKWLMIGAPGIEQEELDGYLMNKPL